MSKYLHPYTFNKTHLYKCSPQTNGWMTTRYSQAETFETILFYINCKYPFPCVFIKTLQIKTLYKHIQKHMIINEFELLLHLSQTGIEKYD